MESIKNRNTIFAIAAGIAIITIAVLFIPTFFTKKESKAKTKKIFISPQQFQDDCFKLADVIFKSNFRPTHIIPVMRGGGHIGNIIDEYFRYRKHRIEHYMPIRVSAYTHDKLKKTVTIFGLEFLAKKLTSADRLLIVDDVIDTGTSINSLLEALKQECKKNLPQEIKVATLYYKPKKAKLKPDYHLFDTSDWIVFPHELEGLTEEEISLHKNLPKD